MLQEADNNLCVRCARVSATVLCACVRQCVRACQCIMCVSVTSITGAFVFELFQH